MRHLTAVRESPNMQCAGIDVSKDTLHLAILNPSWVGEFPNTAAGHRKIVQKLAGSAPCRVVIEATATYSDAVARALAATPGIEVMVANPRMTRNFAKALDQRGKSDGQDRLMLARFAASMPFRTWEPPVDAALKLRQLIRRRGQLVRQQAAEKVRLKEARCDPSADSLVIEDIEENLAHLAKRIERLEKLALAHVAEHDDLEAWRVQLVTIPGVADGTALQVIAELACLPDDMDVRQLTAYAGLDPQPWQSGTMDARRRISKRGNKRLRTTLYMAAWNTARFSPEVKAYRQGLIDRGKPPKLADIAVARRLLHAIVGMRRTNTPWDGSKFYSRAAHA